VSVDAVDLQNEAIERALAESVERFTSANPQSLAQHRRAARVLPGGNTRTVLFAAPFPLTLVSGREARVVSLDGREYIDFLCEYTAGIYGHSNAVIAAAISDALAAGVVLGGHTLSEERFASLLVSRFASLERLRFTNSGTEANLMAVSAAIAATGRRRVVVFDGGYHGSVFNFGSPASSINAPFEFIKARYNGCEETASLLEAHRSDVAAVLVEPMLGSGGCIPAEPAFLQLLRNWCSDSGAILIFDEVMTSRLSPGGLQAALGIRPDLTTLGKYLGGGLSFGAFGGRADIMDRFDPRRTAPLVHAGTFNNNVLTMSAGIAGLAQVFTREAAVKLNQNGEDLRRRLNALAQHGGVPMQFTGIGSMMNVHMLAGPIRSYADVLRGHAGLRELLYFDLLERGIWCARRGMFNLSLPMRDDDFDALVNAVGEFIVRRAGLLLQPPGRSLLT
jgi:glutamate-1-semialdehyde 2,1-aminomutase